MNVGNSGRGGPSVDFNGENENRTVYFAAPGQYLGRKMSSYGGKLNYTIYYDIGLGGKPENYDQFSHCTNVLNLFLGKAVSGADVILQGTDFYLKYESLEQPPPATEYVWTLELVEQNFLLPSGIPAKREHIMNVLQNLKGLYIRATYWSESETTR